MKMTPEYFGLAQRETRKSIQAERRTERERLRDEKNETKIRLREERVASRDTGTSRHVPAWIDWLPRGGWPVVAVIVMVMCAPGEHHLAVMAGWEYRLAWGMPACLVAYAGIAASVATRRGKGAQGRFTAIMGAFISLAAAMAAQPVSHLFVTGHWISDPSPVWLVVSVSCVPPLVLGHLMHMAASHGSGGSATRPSESETSPAETTERPATAKVRDLPRPTETRERPATANRSTQPRPVETSERPATVKPVASPRPVETPDETKTLLTVAEAAAVASQARGETVTTSTIRTWKHRGHLVPALEDDGTLFERDAVIVAATRNGMRQAS